MTERTDHAAEARKAIESTYPIALPYDSAEAQYHGALMEAQVHATLALVEQQRIANLIALAEHTQRRYGTVAGEAGGVGTLLSYGETPDSNMRVRNDVAYALGIREAPIEPSTD